MTDSGGTGETVVAATSTYFSSGPAWSPDGTMLALAEHGREDCGTKDAERLVVFRSDGTDRRNVLSFTCSDGDRDPDWQPLCTLYGSRFGDRLTAFPANEVICALGGNDVIRGRQGNDVILGGDNSDVIDGGPGEDRLFGAGGTDLIRARDGARDVVDGGPGVDRAQIDRGLDSVRSIERLLP